MKCLSCEFTNFKSQIIKNPQNIKEIYKYNFCQNCGLGVIDLDLNKDYSSNYDAEYFEYQEANNSIVTKIIEFFSLTREEYVLKYRKNINTILDVGCGVGVFLSNLKTHFQNLYGTELNEHAKKIIGNKTPSITLIDSNLETDLKFDVITMWHVLEHVNQPVIFLKKIAKNINNGSVIFIEVPNNKSWNFRIFKENYHWISVPEHLYFYNEISLKNIFAKAGLKVINVYYPRQFPFLFTNHLQNKFLKLMSLPISIIMFLISPFFKSSESVRFSLQKVE